MRSFWPYSVDSIETDISGENLEDKPTEFEPAIIGQDKNIGGETEEEYGINPLSIFFG